MSYIMRRKTNDGYRWFIVTPRTTPEGLLKRSHDKCLGDTDEATRYLKARRNSKEGADLYRKFCVSLENIPQSKRKRPRRKKVLV